jgi:hypothetical protein
MNSLITEANHLLKKGLFDYSFCGGYAIELFLCKEIRRHGDIDISAYRSERDKIILFMQSLNWNVHEMCGNGITHHITDINYQIKAKRNIFCFKDNCELISLTPLDEPDMFHLDFDGRGQTKLNFIEFLFNDKTEEDFIYARNKHITLPLDKAVLYNDDIPYLAPELVLLYKSTDIEREGYQLDYDCVIEKMNNEQRDWLKNALSIMNPEGHLWIN